MERKSRRKLTLCGLKKRKGGQCDYRFGCALGKECEFGFNNKEELK